MNMRSGVILPCSRELMTDCMHVKAHDLMMFTARKPGILMPLRVFAMLDLRYRNGCAMIVFITTI